eukprot:tig00020960_g16551.t1
MFCSPTPLQRPLWLGTGLESSPARPSLACCAVRRRPARRGAEAPRASAELGLDHEDARTRKVAPARRGPVTFGRREAFAFLCAGAAALEASAPRPAYAKAATATSSPPAEAALAPDEVQTIKLFEEATKSVVYIDILRSVQTFGNMMPTEIPEGTGSGFIWDNDGHVITNYHVVAPLVGKDPRAGTALARVTVLGVDGSLAIFEGRLVGFDAAKDIAILDIDAPADLLRPMPIGSSAPLRVGQRCLAIGNPFGLDHTLTTGVISGLGRTIVSPVGLPISGAIQTDAAINPGNSGGPLLNSAGQVIGVNASILSKSGTSSGVGFAIPIDTVGRIVGQLLEKGRVTRASLGIAVAPDQIAVQLRIPKGGGALVMAVKPGGPAEKAGVRPTRPSGIGLGRSFALGDIVVGVDDVKVTRYADLFEALDERAPGDKVVLRLLRDGKLALLAIALALFVLPVAFGADCDGLEDYGCQCGGNPDRRCCRPGYGQGAGETPATADGQLDASKAKAGCCPLNSIFPPQFPGAFCCAVRQEVNDKVTFVGGCFDPYTSQCQGRPPRFPKEVPVIDIAFKDYCPNPNGQGRVRFI